MIQSAEKSHPVVPVGRLILASVAGISGEPQMKATPQESLEKISIFIHLKIIFHVFEAGGKAALAADLITA